MSESRRIALFGGTFDPIHDGHLHIASLAKDRLSIDEVRFIPCRISPHKLASHPTPGEDRLQMLRLATAHLPWAAVDPLELERAGPSYSWQTVETLRHDLPDARLFWIMGTDQWEVLPDWAQPEILRRNLDFIVISRGSPPEPREGYRMHFIHTDHPASSTEIRNSLALGGDGCGWLAAPVKSFVEARGLYRPSSP